MEIKGDELWIALPKEARIEQLTWSYDTLVVPLWAAEIIRDQLVSILSQGSMIDFDGLSKEPRGFA